MSEYQYYEFRAIDRPLTQKQMEEVGEYSTRAEITPTSFTNEYHFGSFKGNVLEFIEKYYDAMIYTANWGTHRFVFRVPADLVDRTVADAYVRGDYSDISVKAGNVIFDLSSNVEGGDYDDDSSASISSLISIRAELMGGDLRPLYITWLAAVAQREMDDDEVEPPVPPGMKKLTAAQIDLATFLRVDDDLLDVAVAASADLAKSPGTDDFKKWVTALPAAEKDQILLELLETPSPLLSTRLRRRFQAESPRLVEATKGGRTVSQLLQETDRRTKESQTAAAEAAARLRAKEEAEAAIKRAEHLARLANRGDVPWTEIERLVETKQQGNYDSAVTILKDLRDIALQKGAASQFALRVHSLVDRHAKKTSFRERVMKARVIPQQPGVA